MQFQFHEVLTNSTNQLSLISERFFMFCK